MSCRDTDNGTEKKLRYKAFNFLQGTSISRVYVDTSEKNQEHFFVVGDDIGPARRITINNQFA